MNFVVAQTFLEKQKSFKNVQTAYNEKLNKLEMLFFISELDLKDFQMFIRIFKQEKTLEVWGKKKSDTFYKLIISYPLCSTSGKPGPKRLPDDEQMPEGVYTISQFNPISNFYLSLRLDYPNQADLKYTKGKNPGNNISIHGNCVTTGSFPIGDEAIKELYIMALEATSQNQQRIPVHIFPCKMNQRNMNLLYNTYPEHKMFWEALATVYNYFEEKKKLPLVRITAQGLYEVAK